MTKLEFDNIFEAITEEPSAVAELTLRSDLLNIILDILDEKGWTQAEIAEKLGVPQPRVSELVRGKLQTLSIKTLVGYLASLGLAVRAKRDPDNAINIAFGKTAA